MQDIKTQMNKLANQYADYLLQTNPQLEYWSHESVDGNNTTVLRPSNGIPEGLSNNLMSYTKVLEWIAENCNKYQNWNRFTFMDSKSGSIFICFIIEEGQVNRPYYKFEGHTNQYLDLE